MLNENSILKFGKYKGNKLKNIPGTYLEAFYLSHVHIKLEENTIVSFNTTPKYYSKLNTKNNNSIIYNVNIGFTKINNVVKL